MLVAFTEDYDVTRGGFMGVGLLFMAAAPWLAAWLRGSPVSDYGTDASADRGPTKSQRLP